MLELNRIAFTLFGYPVYWYGALIALGMLLGVLLAAAREKRYGQKPDTMLNFVLVAIPVALVCARLYYVAFSWDAYAANPLEILNVRNGGMAIYGGVLGGLAAGWVYSRRAKVPFGTLADLCAPSLALGQAIGRWGNFFNQEAYGAAVESPSLCFFPAAVYIEAIGEWRYATFFYESAWCFLIVASLLVAERKKLFRRSGDVFIWYVATYAAERMVVEGMRSDSLYLGAIRVSQLLSAGALVLCATLFLIRSMREGRGRTAHLVAYVCVCLTVPLSLIFLSTLPQALHALLALVVCALLYKNTDRKCDSCA